MNKATHWTVPAEHPAFAGHFPGTPIIPGVLLLDIALHTIAATTGIVLKTCTINSVKFFNSVGPGDDVMIEHNITASGTIRFEIVSDTRKVASGSIVPGLPE